MSPTSPSRTVLFDRDFDLVGLGVATLDLLVRVPEFAATESVQRASETRLQGGGPVATALAAAAKLGAKCALIDRQGDDWRGEAIRSELKEWGVDVSHCLIAPGKSSALASVWVRERDGARTIAYDPGTVAPLQAEELPQTLISRSRILHTNGRHEDAWLVAAQFARASGTLVSFDGGAHRYRPGVEGWLPWIDIAIVSKDWAERFSGSTDPMKAAAAIRSAGPTLVAITAGREGSWILTTTESFHQPAFLVPDTIDTTGCGDVYHGVFLAGQAWGWSAERCASFASAAAGLNSRALGGRGQLPGMGAILTFLASRDPWLQSMDCGEGCEA
jgi:sugar/nucleoside kinase (ribokinase family)